jgi:hypothetical protein
VFALAAGIERSPLGHGLSVSTGAGFPEPTRHPITLDGVLEETCAKVRTNLTAREWEKMGATALAVATCPEGAASPEGKAAPSK